MPEFAEHPKVINGCSDLFVEVLGARGRHARSVIGVASLPHQIPIEIEGSSKSGGNDARSHPRTLVSNRLEECDTMLAATLFFAAAITQAPTHQPTVPSRWRAAHRAQPSRSASPRPNWTARRRRPGKAPTGGDTWKAAPRSTRRRSRCRADDAVKAAIVERLLVLFDEPMLNDEVEMLAAFRELIPCSLTRPHRCGVWRSIRNRAVPVDAAEETLLSARRLQPGDIEPLRLLAQFYARRAGAMHAASKKQERRNKLRRARPTPTASIESATASHLRADSATLPIRPTRSRRVSMAWSSPKFSSTNWASSPTPVC